MQQWADETLVATWQNKQGRYKVIELPARQTETFTARKSFRTLEQAEDYIQEQYENVLRVAYEDIQEERERRQVRAQKQSRAEDDEMVMAPFALDALLAEIEAETAYWRETNAPRTPRLAYEQRRPTLRALPYERSALEQITQAMQAEARAAWAQAGCFYAYAASALSSALGKWSWAIEVIASDTPFSGSATEEELEHCFTLPPSLSIETVQAVSPYLLCIYQNVDRVLCLWAELLKRQVLCLTRTLQQAQDSSGPTNDKAVAPHCGGMPAIP